MEEELLTKRKRKREGEKNITYTYVIFDNEYRIFITFKKGSMHFKKC